MTEVWVPFAYRDFYDYPRAIIVERAGQRFFLDCPFDDGLDDYPGEYQVVRLRGDEQLSGSWLDIGSGAETLGTVPVTPGLFDETRRKRLRWDLVDTALGSAPGTDSG